MHKIWCYLFNCEPEQPKQVKMAPPICFDCAMSIEGSQPKNAHCGHPNRVADLAHECRMPAPKGNYGDAFTDAHDRVHRRCGPEGANFIPKPPVP